ncbi:transporter substrate-binding domain-containing protein [Pseudomonas sp. TH31]|uniref:transporter substrate-binding domain-containing protein n=1 Tax=Pseudomonas sp. TH31 TaxID=2796396 RepID=UPI001911BD8E|nr:transporter substrate-binding domain-containing protein [Pseudomonas sp. TH31]MBK5414369.1 transporter substrate-binding domain-containing protein [Pseudomonas sp. TH31]
MSIYFRKWLIAFSLLSVMHTALAATEAPQSLLVLGRSNVDDYSVPLDDQDWRWLRAKGTLLLGASAPDYAPFEITGSSDDYEGLTADYAQLLGELLHVRVEVRRFASRADVVEALKKGEVDLLGTANSFEIADPELAMSSAYAEDQPTLVTGLVTART